MESPCKKYLRWRHSKGYGVHSPFAYRFVTEVLRPGDYGRYAYHAADRILNASDPDRDRRITAKTKFIIRLALFLNVAAIIADSQCPAAKIAAQALNIPFTPDIAAEPKKLPENALMIIEGKPLPDRLIEEAERLRISILAFEADSRLAELLRTPLRHGLLLADTRCHIRIPRPEMEYTRYDISLKMR